MRSIAILGAAFSLAIAPRAVAQRASSPSAGALQQVMGVAAEGFRGNLCLAIRAGKLIPGVQMTLVSVPVVGERGHAETLAARVDSVTSADCVHDENPALLWITDSAYTLSVLRGRAEPKTIYFALLGSVGHVRVRGASAAVVLGATGRPVTLRACTSEEGTHLTAWVGAPIRSRRLWHRYVHSQDDFFPSRCTRAEYGEPD